VSPRLEVPALIRPAAIADLPAASCLAVAERGGEDAQWRVRLAADLADPDACLLVAETDGEVRAYCRARRFDPPPDTPANVAPAGYYLTGLLVAPEYRRRGIGEQLTRARMAWTAERATEIWFFANAANRASLLLHQDLGFREVTRDFTYPGVTFTGGVGVLCRASLTADPPTAKLHPSHIMIHDCGSKPAPWRGF
jgi:ribosomal protein S18 acetylase RimI-like enzyme